MEHKRLECIVYINEYCGICLSLGIELLMNYQSAADFTIDLLQYPDSLQAEVIVDISCL